MIGILGILVFGIVAYLFNQTTSVYGGDSGDLIAAAKVLGIAHPPGYPLYTMLAALLARIPVSTIAYRIGFLSSIPSVLSLLVFFQIVYLLTKNKVASFLTTLTLGTTYIFWLYAVVVEVFALNSLIILAALYVSLKIITGRRMNLLPWLGLLSGLAVAHHHTYVLMVPSFIYLFFQVKRRITGKIYLYSLLLFLIGLTPLLYLPIAASFSPPVNWENPLNLGNFLRLLTRSGYGTFKAGSFAGDTLIQRGISLVAAFRLIISDLRLLGVILVIAGMYSCFRKNRRVFYFLLWAFLSGMFFIFYASFPLYVDFLVGTYERFLIFPLVVLCIFLSLGIVFIADKIPNFLRMFRSFPPRIKRVLTGNNLVWLFAVLPLGLMFINYPKISILKGEQAPENYAREILNSVEANAIVIPSSDTSLFNSQYVYYSEGKWENVKLIHYSKLVFPWYYQTLLKYYPDLTLPKSEGSRALLEFIEENSKILPVYSKEVVEGVSGEWMVHGHLWKYYPKGEQIDKDEIINFNTRFWEEAADPRQYSLGKYRNLLIADLLREYHLDINNFALLLLSEGRYDQAIPYLLKSLDYESDNDTRIYLGLAYLALSRCNEAESYFMEVTVIEKENIKAAAFLYKTYNECFKDQVKSSEAKKTYEDLLLREQTSVEKL